MFLVMVVRFRFCASFRMVLIRVFLLLLVLIWFMNDLLILTKFIGSLCSFFIDE